MAEEKSSRNKWIIRLVILAVVLAIGIFAYMYFSERARLLNAGRYFTYGENKFKEAQGIPIDPSEAVSAQNLNKPIDVALAYEAIDNYRKSVTYDDQRADSWVGMAKVHTKLKEFDKAIEVLEEAAQVKFEQTSNKVTVFSALGDAYFTVGEFRKAADAYTQAIEASPLNPLVALAYAKKAISLLELGDLSEVDKFTEWVRQGQSLDSRAENQHIYHYALGWTYYVRGRSDQALAEYQEAMSFNNNYPPLLYKVASLERENGLFFEPFVKYRRAVEISTFQGVPYTPAENAYREMQEELAKMDVNEQAKILVKMAEYYTALGKHETVSATAVTDLYNRVLEIAPESPSASIAYAQLASLLLDTRDYELLEQNSPKAIEMALKGAEVADSGAGKAANYLVISKAYRSVDNYDAAIEAAKKAVEADPTNFKTYLELTINYYEAYTSIEDEDDEAMAKSEAYIYGALENINKAKSLTPYDRDVESYYSRVTRAVERWEQQKNQR